MKNTFNHQGNYVCECGREFTNSQSFNGHKGHCKIHLGEERYNKNHSLVLDKQSMMTKTSSEKRIEKSNLKKIAKIDAWKNSNPKCEKCGKPLTEYCGSGRFCSKACANSRAHSEETKQKISKSLSKEKEIKFCKICGKELNCKNETGYCNICYRKSSESSQIRTQIAKKGAETRHKNGTTVGWQSRNILSYPEKFWTEVLDKNGIKYKPNFPVRKSDGINNYFLDFYIEVDDLKIDLEIDGKQHGYEDRKEHDTVRNEYLTSVGYFVYRIKWNEINSDEGKLLMKDKIDSFINFYNSL